MLGMWLRDQGDDSRIDWKANTCNAGQGDCLCMAAKPGVLQTWPRMGSTAIGCNALSSAAGWRVHAVMRTCRAQCLWMAVMSSSRVPLCMSRSLCTALYRRREAVCTQTEHAECKWPLARYHKLSPLQVLRGNVGPC